MPDEPSDIKITDENDRWVMESAIRAEAEILEARDKDLLDISHKVSTINIISPREFLGVAERAKRVKFWVINRSVKYYRNGTVRSLDEQESGIWTGIVEGTILYRLEIHLGEDHEIKKVGRNCPYDYGLICKHLVAAFYTLRERLDGDASAGGESC